MVAGEYADDLGVVAAAVLDDTGTPIAALSVMIPVDRLQRGGATEFGGLLVEAAAEVSASVGGRCAGGLTDVRSSVLRSRQSTPPAAPPTLSFAGAGMISVIHGLAAAAAGLPVVAVASRTDGRSQERAAQLQARACSYDDLPAGADAVVVATPPALHVPQALAALRAGAAVLVEKPIATTLQDADALVAAEEAGGIVVYAENLAFAPVVRAGGGDRQRHGAAAVHRGAQPHPPPDLG